MAIKQIVGTSPYQDAAGNVLASGALTLDLSQPATATGSGEVAPLRITVALNTSGTFSATNLWANDQLAPTGTTYRLRAYNNNGLLAGDWGPVSIQGTSPIDISTLVPVSTGGSVVLLPLQGVVLLNPSALQTIAGFPLASAVFQSSAANPAQSGVLRLANADSVGWRNSANSGDVPLQILGTQGGNFPPDTLYYRGRNDGNAIIETDAFASNDSPSVIAATGFIRMGSTRTLTWRNNANTADLAYGKNASDSLTFNGLIQPQVVAALNLTGQTTSLGPATLYNVPAGAAGFYRASLSLILTTQGTGGNLIASLIWNNGTLGNSSTAASLPTTGLLGSEINSFNNAANNFSPVNFYNTTGSNIIQYQVAFGGVTGSPAYTVRIRLEYLG